MAMKTKTLLMANGAGYVLQLDPAIPYGSVEIRSAVACMVKVVKFSLTDPAPTAPSMDPTPVVAGETSEYWPMAALDIKKFGVRTPKGAEDGGRFTDTIQYVVVWSMGAGTLSVDAQ